MIAFLNGRVAHKGTSWAVIEVGGVGFKLNMSTSSLAALPSTGDDVQVHTYLHVREDELTLYGFESEAEQSAFEQLITVSGVGPKVALAALSTLAPDELAAAVAAGDVAVVSSIPGVGNKTAQRIILELKDKLGALESGAQRPPAAASSEATLALAAMGISAPEASAAMRGYAGDPANVEELVKYALKRLGGGS